MRRLTFAAFILLAGPLAQADGLDHPSAPMLAPAQSALSMNRWIGLDEEPAAMPTRSRAKVVDEFRSLYARKGSPLIAVFWEKGFDGPRNESLADWSFRRNIDAHSFGVHTCGNAERKYLRDPITGQASWESCVPNENLFSASNSRVRNGFVRNLMDGGVRVLDRDRTALSSFTTAPHCQRAEIGPMLEHADYLVEVRRAREHRAIGEIYARDLRDGSVVALFRSSGEPRDMEQSARWVATSRGYEWRRRPVTPEDQGGELALAVMEALSAAWQTP